MAKSTAAKKVPTQPVGASVHLTPDDIDLMHGGLMYEYSAVYADGSTSDVDAPDTPYQETHLPILLARYPIARRDLAREFQQAVERRAQGETTTREIGGEDPAYAAWCNTPEGKQAIKRLAIPHNTCPNNPDLADWSEVLSHYYDHVDLQAVTA
jgi:hypothetical protein